MRLLPSSETLEAEKAILEERCEDRINILQTHLKKYYRKELMVRFHKHLSPNDTWCNIKPALPVFHLASYLNK